MSDTNTIKISKYHVIFVLFLIGLGASAILSFEQTNGFCKPGEGCDTIQNSIYAHTLGIKNSLYGVIIFSLLLIITGIHAKKYSKNLEKIINLSIILGSIMALWFIYLQKFVLEAWCRYCLVVDVAMFIALAVIIFWKR